MKSDYIPKLLEVLEEPNPILRKASQQVADFNDPKIYELIEDMIFTMRKQKGIGLAAIQVGIELAIIVIETKDGAMTFVNPEIVNKDSVEETSEEGCLSLPGQYGFVKRSTKLTVKSFDVNGNEQLHDAEGLFARVLQHEMDHLSGVLFIDKLENNPEQAE